jgi:hypothetical protein
LEKNKNTSKSRWAGLKVESITKNCKRHISTGFDVYSSPSNDSSFDEDYLNDHVAATEQPKTTQKSDQGARAPFVVI